MRQSSQSSVIRSFPAMLIALMLVVSSGHARTRALSDDTGSGGDYATTAAPSYCAAMHNVGNIVLAITNYGVFAAQDGALRGTSSDCFTGASVLACEFPKRSGTQYSFSGAFWIGAVVGRDTLVSVGADGWNGGIHEFNPDQPPFGDLIRRSIIDPEGPEFADAVSEQDFVAVYTDTFTSGVSGLGQDYFGRPHRPLNIEVTQRSYAWSYPYAEDFVLFDYAIKNIGNARLNQVYMGLYVDADVHPSGDFGGSGAQDDICGFLESLEVYEGRGECPFVDTVNIAWIADNDGDLDAGGLFATPVPAVTATRIVRTPSDSLNVSFNWWISNGSPTLDFGPQSTSTYRNFQTGGSGTPEGDVNKYYLLRNGEFDYDQAYTATIQPTDPEWLYPPRENSLRWSQGLDTRYLLSFGPFTIDPGQSLPISFAYVAGEGFHSDENNYTDNMLTTYDPDAYYNGLSFSDLALNARWASWVYDNPGYSSEGGDTSYLGKYWICCLDTTGMVVDSNVTPWDTTYLLEQCDTIYYQGDGVADFRGASPPPAPFVWLEPSVGQIVVRINGQRSENTRDVFSREIDFEGYRIYLGRDDRESSFSLIASYDIEDYNKIVWDVSKTEWVLADIPFSLDALRGLYGGGNPDWTPDLFTRTSPYTMPGFPDSVFAFEAQDFNRSEFGNTTPLTRRFPSAPKPPTLDVDSIPADQYDLYLTGDGFFKYYEYEYTLTNLLPTVPYYVSVTAFDFGSPASGLPALETSKTISAKSAYPLASLSDVEAQDLKVYVWPNPYRTDADYLERGFEGRFSRFADPIVDRERRVHFANLPPVCTIRIYSLDGDLVREIEHEADVGDPLGMQDEWDLISRNTQLVVSGIYYWTVEEPDGTTQIGKLVIIM